MMDNQPEALRLAHEIEAYGADLRHCQSWAAELRRLHAENERKSEAIQKLWKERDEAIAENERLRAERDDFQRRWEAERRASEATISGGRYPDGQPAW